MEEVIDSIIFKTKNLANLKSIIRYDKDLYFLSEEPNPDKFEEKVVESLSKIKHDFKISVINIHHHAPELMSTLIRKGQLLFGSVILSHTKLNLRPYYLFSYCLSNLSKSDKVKISKRIHGSKAKVKGKTYHYKGLKELQGNKLISSSTMLVSEENYQGFKIFLEHNNVKHSIQKIWIE